MTKENSAKHYKIHHFGTGKFQKQGVSKIAVFQALMTKMINGTIQSIRGDVWRHKTEKSKQMYYLASEW